MMRVAKVIDSYTLAITGGADVWVEVGEWLIVAENIIDPETGESLGTYPNLKVLVSHVFPRFCVAETTVDDRRNRYKTLVVNVGDEVRRCK